MNDQTPLNQNVAGTEDTYDVLHKNFSLFGDDDLPLDETDVKNNGEIYFSANADNQRQGIEFSDIDFARFYNPRARQQGAGANRPNQAANNGPVNLAGAPRSNYNAYQSNGAYGTQRSGNPYVQGQRSAQQPAAKPAPAKSEAAATKTVKKKKKKKKVNRKGSFAKSLLLALVVLGFVVLASLVISDPVKSCMNDIIAIDRSSGQRMVVLEKDMTTDEVIDKLKDSGMIYSATFCKFASHILHFDQDDPSKAIYPAGSYLLSYDMGIEGMLKEIISNGEVISTVKVSFPEGFTVDQIVERLASNGVASAASLYEAMNSDEIFEQYSFLQDMENRSERYRALEGYLYPDTYEFYLGENPQSVVKRFLDNFVSRWEAKYENMAADSGRSVDELIIVASILQKEANDPVQMRTIASIIYNRLESGSFPFINCDSTAKYIENRQEQLESEGTYEQYLALYDSYVKEDLPVGPICNPGEDAIIAALRPEDTDYYYFLHDSDGDLHPASSAAEHDANKARYLSN